MIPILLLASFILRLAFMSPWLEDWDSIQFAMALKDFSMIDHLPHPPGYILYIFLGRVFNLFFQNQTLSLTLLSAALGSLSLIPFYLLAKEMFGKKSAIISTIIFSVTPLHWSLSEVALSNTPGVAFGVLTAYLLYKARSSKYYLLIGSFVGGITLGVRFSEYTTVLPLLILTLFIRRSFTDTVKSVTYFSAGFLVWFTPLVVDTGFNNLITLYKTQIDYIASHDSLLAYPTLVSRFKAIYFLIRDGYSYFAIPIFIFGIWNLRKNTFLAIWFMAYSIPLLFFYNLEVPRHVLPLFAPILLSYSKRPFFYLILIPALFATSLSQVAKIKTLTPPTISPILFTKNNFDPSQTILITSFLFRHFQYYAPEFENYWGIAKIPKDLRAKYIITDFENFAKDERIKKSYHLLDQKNFTGPKEIFPRVSDTKLFILLHFSEGSF